MRRSDILRILTALFLGVIMAWGGVGFGCNPNLTQSLGGTANLPTAPGETPYVLLRMTNAITGPTIGGLPTGAPVGVNYLITWRYAGGTTDMWGTSGGGLAATEDLGVLIPCNVTVITMGDVDDLTADGAWLAYHGALDFVQEALQPFGKLLQNGVDFRCGDVLTFVTYNDSSNARGYSVDYQVQSGQDVTGPFTGPSTFTNYDKEAKSWQTFFGP